MEIIIDEGCGLDVHKETVVACIMGTGVGEDFHLQVSAPCRAHK